jgi:hypothetical protein
MFQGKFYFYEYEKECRRGSFNFICFDELDLPPKIHLLDRATDRFVEQKVDINYLNYEFFWMSS